jgi:hypothetical protein
MTPAELFARNFERFFLFVGRHGECRRHRVPDTFDGTPFGADAFAAFTDPFLGDPAGFYRTPADEIDVREEDRAPRAAAYRALWFTSPYRSGFPENDRVPFKWFRGAVPSRIALVFAPGWPRQDQHLEERIARRFVERGVDVALLTVPFHQARTPRGAYSGEYFISSNPLWTIENFRQFVAEIRLVTRYLRRDYDAVGLLGLSSGGVHAGLAAYCEDVDFYVPVMSACDLGGLMWDSSITSGIRAQLHERGVTRADLEKFWRIADIAHLRAPLRARRVFQIVTRYDGIVPEPFQAALWEALGRPPRTVLPTSHFGIVFFVNALADRVCDFIELPGTVTATAQRR